MYLKYALPKYMLTPDLSLVVYNLFTMNQTLVPYQCI